MELQKEYSIPRLAKHIIATDIKKLSISQNETPTWFLTLVLNTLKGKKKPSKGEPNLLLAILSGVTIPL